MKKLLILWMAICASLFDCFAETPDIYLRGESLPGGWGTPSDEMKFKPTGNAGEYTLCINSLEGFFKIASADWSTVDLGAAGMETPIYNGVYKLTYKGSNFRAPHMEGVTLTLNYNPNGQSTLTVSAQTGGEKPELKPSGSLPILYINTDPAMLSKDLADKDYRDGEYWLDAGDCTWAQSVGSPEKPLPLEIKARGNYTRTAFAKKPFKLKLGKKQSLLGLSKSKHFALLAHADDWTGYMQNFVAFSLGKKIGLPWTPTEQPIEVVMNGDYRGIYFLTESIRIEEERINIAELADNETDPTLCSGGYLIELDNYEEGEQIIQAEPNGNDKMRVTFDTPEVLSPLQRQFLENQFYKMNALIGSRDPEIWSYIDMDVAVRYYIVMEIIHDREAYHGSTYMFRDRGEGMKWKFSPIWDSGNAMGRENPQSFFYQDHYLGNLWIANLCKTPGFMDRVKATWRWFWGTQVGEDWSDIKAEIDRYASYVQAAAIADYARWKDAPWPNGGGQDVMNNTDMPSRVEMVKSRLSIKTSWLATQWGMPSADSTEPAPDTTPAAPLPDFVSSTIDQISNPAYPTDTAYYNLQGMRIINPQSGQILIKVSNGQAQRIRITK